MKLKILLFSLLLTGGMLQAQDTIRTLIITESRIDRLDQAFVELTNVGTEPIQMNNFKFGTIIPSKTPWDSPSDRNFMLPDKVLQPGESFTIAAVLDFVERQHFIDPDNYDDNITKKEWWTLADMQMHMADKNGDETDSISPHSQTFAVWHGNYTWFIEQHLSETDSVVVDQVGGVFDGDNGRNQNKPYDVAGVTDATYNSILVRRYIVKNGNINFAEARGVGLEDSEWMPIPLPYENYDTDRAVFWTVGNHGDYNFDENTLVSDIVDVDLTTNTITVPWGTRNNDDFMTNFEKKPGVAWHYDLSEAYIDSAYNSARTGDKITIFVCGNDLDKEVFNIVVAEPTTDANIVISKYRPQGDGYYTNAINSGHNEVFEITRNASGMDTITNDFYGIPFATSVDTLLKYLEVAPKASIEIEWVDGTERTAVINGDILKVTAENGDVKEYFIKVNGYRPSHNAYLSYITWPDIPEFYKGIMGWMGDTIPNFGATNFNYKVQVPLDVDGIPALVAKTEDLNSKVSVKRASTLDGTVEQKTVIFTVTAEDNTTTNVYNVQLEKEKDFSDIQPFYAEPFISEYVCRDQFKNNFTEVCNPGNQPLDLSNYMFYWGGSDPAGAITGSSGVDQWMSRYNKYIPGYKWVDEIEWSVSPATLVQDLSVNSVILPGDVFVMADIIKTPNSGFPWYASDQSDIIFQTDYNPWNEANSKPAIWMTNNIYMFKILNDSIKTGLKPATDPNDFELIETFGMGDGSKWVIGGKKAGQVHNYIRKPEFYKGKPRFKESFGTNPDDSEWLMYNEKYWKALNTPWPARRLNITNDIGKHFMNEVTVYKSTVTSIVYKVSSGYSTNEKIRGVRSGTTVSDFLGGIVKADENQTLTLLSVADGSELAQDAVLNLNDTLIVLSADSVNTSKYVLNVTDEGLSSDALLVSNKYEINVSSGKSGNTEPGRGTIKGFEYGTSLKTIIANITVPAGASLDMIDGEGAYVPLIRQNFDTSYVNVTVNDNIYFEVTAEDGVTKILYRLIPDVSLKDAFITSDVYSVIQKNVLIRFVPRGTTASSFLANLVPSSGASIILVDKLGKERTEGNIAVDDKVIVTSANGEVTKAYFISMLAEKYIPETTYLAYILSSIYTIDQVNYTINGVNGDETLDKFYSRIRTSMGATAVVVDKDGNEKTSGDIDGSDKVKVTSVDGKVEVLYTFGQLTGNEIVETNNIELYPNPTNGQLNISGVERGNRIQVFNSTGAAIRTINVENSIETISLQKEPAGMYLIVISNNNKLLGRYKAIKN